MSDLALDILVEYPDWMYEAMTGDVPIRTYPDPVLLEPCEPIAADEFGENIQALGDTMLMVVAREGGLGLAASQIGILKRMFVMKATAESPGEIICNPVLKAGPETEAADEGCLSLPGAFQQVVRSVFVDMQYQTPDGTYKMVHLSRMPARIAQHEVDHLDGIMFHQRMTRQMRKQVLKAFDKETIHRARVAQIVANTRPTWQR